MPRLIEKTIGDMIAHLPDWVEAPRLPHVDLFIGSIGFEDRSPASFVRWCATASSSARALLVQYPFNPEDNAAQRDKFEQAAAGAGVKISIVPYNRLSTYGEIAAALRQYAPQSILLDISSLGSFAFFPVLAAVLDSGGNAELHICYAEAKQYFPAREEWEAFQERTLAGDLVEKAELFDQTNFQSKGVDCVFQSPNYSGTNIDTLPTNLVVIPNFSYERVNRMIMFAVDSYGVKRNNCEWIIGLPPNHDSNGWRYDAVWELFDRPGNRQTASTLHYKETVLVLHEIWEKSRWQNALLVATIGSKSQHLALSLFLRMHLDIGLILSEPQQFVASRFSAGVGGLWKLTLGKITDVDAVLRRWDRLEFDWHTNNVNPENVFQQ